MGNSWLLLTVRLEPFGVMIVGVKAMFKERVDDDEVCHERRQTQLCPKGDIVEMI